MVKADDVCSFSWNFKKDHRVCRPRVTHAVLIIQASGSKQRYPREGNAYIHGVTEDIPRTLELLDEQQVGTGKRERRKYRSLVPILIRSSDLGNEIIPVIPARIRTTP